MSRIFDLILQSLGEFTVSKGVERFLEMEEVG